MAAPDTMREREAGAPLAPAASSRTREVARLLVSNRLALAGVVVLGALVLLALFAPLIAPFGINEIAIDRRLEAPSAARPFGTDQLGRDIFSRVLIGTRISLQVGFVAVSIALVFGVILGLVAGYYGGKTDDALMRLMDVFFAFPAILLAIAVLAILGPGITNAMIAIGIVYMPIFARITRASVLSVREEVYVRAARSIGAGDLRILRLHVLPNVAAPIIVQVSLALSWAILTEAGLSFLGLGTTPPDASLGLMISEARTLAERGWWLLLFPSTVLVAAVVGLNLLGDGLRDVLDPTRAHD